MSLLPHPNASTARILVVDDDEDLGDVMAMILRGAGYNVEAVGNGVEALGRLEQQGYDLVVSDLQMPALDGPSLYREVTRRWPSSHPRVLFVSGFVDTAEYVSFLNVVNVSVLVKPFSVDDLRGMVRRVLEGADAHPRGG